MKRITAIILVFLTILTFAMPKSYAEIASPSTLGEDLNSVSSNDLEDEMENGTASYTSEDADGTSSKKTKSFSSKSKSTGKNVLRFLMLILTFIPKIGNFIIREATNTGEDFTIIGLLSNKFDLFGINFWEDDTGRNNDLVNSIRDNVAKWYVGVRDIAAIIIMIILLYTGLRMALLMATGDTASAKQIARYKEMLINWVIGIILIFVIHLLMIATIYLSNMMIKLLVKVTETSINSNIETQIIDKTYNGLFKNETTSGHPVYFFITYCVLTYYEIKFFVVYLLRTFKIYFYVVISPLVCATYPLDKMRDGRAQGFQNWWTEFFTEVIRQPIQLFVFTVFVLSADEIFISQPLLFVILIGLISNIERVVNGIILRRRGTFTKELKDVRVNDLVPTLKK